MIIPNELIQSGYTSGSRRESKEVTTFGTQIEFTKMVASGNDFIIIENSGHKVTTSSFALLRTLRRRTLSDSEVQSQQSLAKKICDRKYGVGADGLLVLEKSKIADIKMRIFNPDGSEPSMCGNGARCVALYKSPGHHVTRSQVKIETKAGIIESIVNKGNVKIKLVDPKEIKLNIPLKINNRLLKANFINTGVPHTVIFVEGLDKIDVFNLGRQIRYHRRFLPEGTNVDFVQIIDDNNIKLRTYERGVEDETLACGTGAVASALLTFAQPREQKEAVSLTEKGVWGVPLAGQRSIITSLESGVSSLKFFKVHTKGDEILKVYFKPKVNGFSDVWLEGKAKIVYKGEYYV